MKQEVENDRARDRSIQKPNSTPEVPVVQGLLEQWLFDAIHEHDLADAQLRLRQGAAIDGVKARAPVNGRTALHEAAEWGAHEIAQALILAGANPDARDLCGKTPLHWVCRCAKPSVGHVLLQANADPSATTFDNSWTPLHYLGQHWKDNDAAAFAQALLNAGADPEAINVTGDTPLHVCAQFNNVYVAKVLLTFTNTWGGRGSSIARLPPLAVAALHGSIEVASLLVEQGAQPFSQCQGLRAASTSSAIGLARVHGHNRLAKILKGPLPRAAHTAPAYVKGRPSSAVTMRARRKLLKTADK